MFSKLDVANEINKFVRVRLYRDGEGEQFERQQRMQQEKFGAVALPYYAILVRSSVINRWGNGNKLIWIRRIVSTNEKKRTLRIFVIVMMRHFVWHPTAFSGIYTPAPAP